TSDSFMPTTFASSLMVRARSFVCSRTIALLYDSRFSTSTPLSRATTPPRGARNGSVRWWLFSASSSNFACCTTCSIQKPNTRTPNSTPIDTCSTDRRISSRRRSSAGFMGSEVPAILRRGQLFFQQLFLVQFCVQAVVPDQFVVRPAFDDAPLVEHEGDVGVADGR